MPLLTWRLYSILLLAGLVAIGLTHPYGGVKESSAGNLGSDCDASRLLNRILGDQRPRQKVPQVIERLQRLVDTVRTLQNQGRDSSAMDDDWPPEDGELYISDSGEEVVPDIDDKADETVDLSSDKALLRTLDLAGILQGPLEGDTDLKPNVRQEYPDDWADSQSAQSRFEDARSWPNENAREKRYRSSAYDCIMLNCSGAAGERRNSCIVNNCVGKRGGTVPRSAGSKVKRYRSSAYDCILLNCSHADSNSRKNCILNKCHNVA